MVVCVFKSGMDVGYGQIFFFFSLILTKQRLKMEISNIAKVVRIVIRNPPVPIIYLGRNANSQAPKKSYRIKTLGGGSSNLWTNESSRWVWRMLNSTTTALEEFKEALER